MIKVSQEEAAYLRQNGRSHDIHMSSATHKSKRKRYYATTSPKTMMFLEKFWADKTFETFT